MYVVILMYNHAKNRRVKIYQKFGMRIIRRTKT